MATPSVAEYLLLQLQNAGVEHVFGAAGDYILGLYDKLTASPLRPIGTSREDTAALVSWQLPMTFRYRMRMTG